MREIFLVVGGFWWALSYSCAAPVMNAQHLCEKHILKAEKDHKIPRGILSAISLIESGRDYQDRMTGVKGRSAWPWTLNIKGRAHFFDSKAQALAALERALKMGETNIDVGCMQLNYRHHGRAFSSPRAMLDPARNVVYAAQFLLRLHKNHNSWTKSVGNYHSATLRLQEPYRKKVYRAWRDRLAAVRSQESLAQEPIAASPHPMRDTPRLPRGFVTLSHQSRRLKAGRDSQQKPPTESAIPSLPSARPPRLMAGNEQQDISSFINDRLRE